MSFLDQLNEHQLEAVQCVDHHLRIIAGAGSGKTRVVTTRIAYLINDCGVYPNKVLAITFTNKAAREMKERVENLLGDVAKAVTISTIHSFCVRLLREDILELGYPRNFTILDADDQKSILRDAYKQMHIDVKSYSYNSVLSYISNNKTNFIDAATAKAGAGKWAGEQIKADVYEFYEKRLKEMYALDFDDLLIFVHRILKSKEEVRAKWQRRFTYLHVDEFQDVDNLQYAIIKLLVKEGSYLCVVGDPDQTIYTWRGAQVDIIMNFERDFPDSHTVVLNENYRSTQQILNGANALIKNNRNRIDKDLFTRVESEDKIIHFSAMDDANEPVWVASKIMTLHHDHVDYRDIAILYRSNFLSRGLEKVLLDFHIPYRIYGGVRFYDRAEIKDALSYLRLLAPFDEQDPKALYKNLAVKRVINSPKRGIGAKTLETIELQANHDETNMYDVLCEYEIGKGKARANIQAFVAMIEECRMLVDTISIDQLLEKVLEDSGYLDMLREDKEIERLENIKELIGDISDYVEAHPEGTLNEYLQEISLYSDKEEQENGDFVQLMTIHAAKGLEFDNVFVYSLCEGIFPNERSVGEGGQPALEEERRLAYVAFTRAKKQLFLSDSYGYSYVLDKIKTTSRFIKELPEDCIEDVGAKPRNTFSSDVDTFSGSDFLSMHSSDMVQHRPQESSGYARQAERKLSDVRIADSFDGAPIINEDRKPKKKGKIRKGDLVHHESFGDGVVIKLEEQLATIAFEQKFGIRKIKIDHPALSKK
ncbi:ATP-dependent helicase [[Clostridium] innocuum]|uniref:ATP-dependent helicase n=1 Tax=Clostridium innocuum TaxID=1522 RepID=UPI001C394F45|nr:UvrD-helicase domain-containing protein [[Clostridium] innocuum]MBV4170292.1 UvrD-helicase domain-containing protein [[Clostridium] innocuum]